MGTAAPEPLPDGEVWLDIGSRLAPRVIDHHGGDTDAPSAAQPLLGNYRELLLEPLQGHSEITIVLHSDPDLDAICSAWLARKILMTGLLDTENTSLEDIVRVVSENDQGYTRYEDPLTCWPVVFRTMLNTEYGNFDDHQKVFAGFNILDLTLDTLLEGGTLETAAGRVISSQCSMILHQAYRDYLDDLSRGIRFQVRLPVRDAAKRKISNEITVPDRPGGRWSIADGLFLDDPKSQLFKELARGDLQNSTLKRGFTLLVVTRDMGETPYGRRLKQHIISTDPLSGLHLKGLGHILELKEKRKEDDHRDPLLPERQRVGKGKGRWHDSDVVSPWYDGRGHEYTIIDCPGLTIGNKSIAASVLSSSEVLETIWDYGDPAAHVSVQECQVFLYYPAIIKGKIDWDTKWDRTRDLQGICEKQYLCEEIFRSLTESDPDVTPLTIRYRTESIAEAHGETCLAEQEIWCFENEIALWVGRFVIGTRVKTLRDLYAEIIKIRTSNVKNLLPGNIDPAPRADSCHVVHVRVNPADMSLDYRKTGASAQIIHQLAVGDAPRFVSNVEIESIPSSDVVSTNDRRFLVYPTPDGISVLSTRPAPFVEEDHFCNPERFRLLMALALARRTALDHVSESLAEHQLYRDFKTAGTKILQDEWKLIMFEQLLSFPKIAGIRFGQNVYDAVSRAFTIGSLAEKTKGRIKNLSEHVRDSRAEFFETLSFWISVVFAPLAITAGIFSGVQLERNYSDNYLTFLPDYIPFPGLAAFLAVFLIAFAITLGIWIFVTRSGIKKK